MLRSLRIDVFLDPFTEVLDRQGKIVFRPVNPLLGSRLALAQGFAERLDDFIPVELVRIPLGIPFQASQFLVGSVERLQFAFGFKVSLHVGDMRMVAAVTLQLIQDLEEHSQNEVASSSAAVIGLTVDIE